MNLGLPQRPLKTTGAIMLLVMMAFVFSYAIAITGIPKQLATWVGAQEMTALTLMLLIGVVYLLMGCIIDSIGMMVITVPFCYQSLRRTELIQFYLA